ncbi:MAG: hypothetical protein AB7U98_14790 [Candidatus Nitrosocosmicus sp.]
MTNQKSLVLLLTLSILFSTFFNNSVNVTTEIKFVQNVYAHNFTPNNYASLVSSIDKFQIESKLVYDNLMTGNSSLAEKHAAEAVSIFSWDLMLETEERDKKVSDEIKTAIENLQNISSSFSSSVATNSLDPNKLEQMDRASQLVKLIDANTNIMINITESQQQIEDSNPLNQVVLFLTNIFTGQENSNNTSIHPMRFAEVVDSVLRNYGDAYDVKFDMTDMTNMANMDNDQSLSMTNKSADNYQNKINSIENAASYQSAMGLAEHLLKIFDDELLPSMAANGTSALSTNLREGILHLSSSIKDKASPEDIMMIVHTQIHPNLIKAFNLQILSDA